MDTVFLGILSPIYNEPGCSPGPCHVHTVGKKILGALDVVVSLDEADREVNLYIRKTIGFAILVFLIISVAIFVFVFRFVRSPMKELIAGTRGDSRRRNIADAESGPG